MIQMFSYLSNNEELTWVTLIHNQIYTRYGTDNDKQQDCKIYSTQSNWHHVTNLIV